MCDFHRNLKIAQKKIKQALGCKHPHQRDVPLRTAVLLDAHAGAGATRTLNGLPATCAVENNWCEGTDCRRKADDAHWS